MLSAPSRPTDSYRVWIHRRAEKDLRRLSFSERRRLLGAAERLAINPRRRQSKKLVGSLDRYRLRVGSYRILYTIDDSQKIVVVYAFGHRQGIY